MPADIVALPPWAEARLPFSTINSSALPMRTINRLVLIFCLGLAVFGCSNGKGGYVGPTVDAFHGKVTHNGNPVTFADEEVKLSLFHEKGEQFGIPLKADGTFEIGWMPTGKYSMMLERQTSAKKGAQMTRYNVPGSLTIEDGKKDYVIELGKNFKH
jgi:hypothetical protein